VHPDGKRVYISNGGEASVSVLDTATNTIVATIPVGQRPWNMGLTPDGRKALRRQRPLQLGFGHRHAHPDEASRHRAVRAPLGRGGALNQIFPPAAT